MNSNKYPSIQSSIIILLLFILFTIIIGFPIIYISEYTGWIDENIATAFAYVLPMLATIYVAYRNIIKAGEVISVFSFRVGGVKKYFFIIPLIIVMMLWVDFFASLIPMPDWAIILFEEAFNLSIPNIIMISVFAPLLEEVLVRGLVLRGYLLNYTPNKAIIASAVFFGAIHMNPWQFVAGFISGLFLGYLYYKTKSLFPSILVHLTNNSLAVVFSLYYTNADASFKDMLGNETYYVVLIVSLALGYVLFNKLDKILSTEKVINSTTNQINN